MNRADNTATISTIVGVSIALWGGFIPWPYVPVVAVLAITPLLALILTLVRGGALFIDPEHPGDASRSPFVGMFHAPIMALAWRGLDPTLVDAPLALGMTLLGAVILTPVFARTAANNSGRMFAVILVFAAWYSWGVVSLADTVLDRGAPTIYPANVTQRERTYGKYPHAYLYLDTQEQSEVPSRLDVDDAFFRQINVGDRICVAVHPGLLRVRWSEISFCPAKYLTDKSLAAD